MNPMQIDDCFLTKRNPGASSDLVIPVRLESVQTEDVSERNCRENVKRDIPWLKASPVHRGVALVCGSAPSLADNYDLIRTMQAQGAIVFAGNAAARLMHEQGIDISYQIIVDGLEEARREIFPAHCHLMASILPPDFLDQPNVILWHPLIDEVISVVDGMDRDFAYIGGGISVSLFALCIVHTMGYRRIHCFGMDSSFRGERFHVDDEGMEGPFLVDVEHNGKIYHTTYDMKMQASVFLQLERQFKQAGSKIEVHGTGLLPDAWSLTT